MEGFFKGLHIEARQALEGRAEHVAEQWRREPEPRKRHTQGTGASFMERFYYQESAAKKERKLETEGKSFFIMGAGDDYGVEGNN